jgi:magnesium transporter
VTDNPEPAAPPGAARPLLNAALVDSILAAVEVGARERLVALLEPFHEADIADLIEQIDPASREKLIRLWGDDIYPLVLSELEEGVRDILVPLLSESQLRRVVAELPSDDVVYLVEDLDEPEQEKVLEALDGAERAAVESALAYPEYTAGRLMQRSFVLAPEHWTVGDAIDHMRAAEDLPETFYDVIIVDPRLRPVGTVALSRIMANRREVPLRTLMSEDFRSFRAETPQEDVAWAFNQYHLVSAPVTDAHGRLVGVITVDDALEILKDEADEDMKRLAGVGDEEISDRVWETARLRAPWLLVNLGTAILAANVIARFSDAIEEIVALAVLMPIVASMGGNAGTQTLTVVVRALATRSLTSANTWRIVRREALVGLSNGFGFALAIAAVALLWFGSAPLAAVIGAAMVINLLVAGLAGILVPLGLARLGADPAIASGTFVTTVTDVIGFAAFLGLATLVLL